MMEVKIYNINFVIPEDYPEEYQGQRFSKKDIPEHYPEEIKRMPHHVETFEYENDYKILLRYRNSKFIKEENKSYIEINYYIEEKGQIPPAKHRNEVLAAIHTYIEQKRISIMNAMNEIQNKERE